MSKMTQDSMVLVMLNDWLTVTKSHLLENAKLNLFNNFVDFVLDVYQLRLPRNWNNRDEMELFFQQWNMYYQVQNWSPILYVQARIM
jgi:hypothetical protein